MKIILKLLRVKHYLKNFLILLPIFFGKEIFNPDVLLCAMGGVIAFSLISSSIYIINDIRDIEKDRLHPTKKNRPIASGAIQIHTAYAIAVFCFVISIVCSIVFSSWKSTIWLLLYFILNLLYSMGLKNVPLVDVAILTSGFVIRVLYGAALSHVQVSSWLYLTVMSAAFYMGLGKRRNECVKQSSEVGSTRSVLKYYTYAFLDKNMYVCLALTDVFYALWAINYNNSNMLMTIPVVILILMKYSLNIEGNSDGDPVEVIFRDKILIILAVIYAVIAVPCIYIGSV